MTLKISSRAYQKMKMYAKLMDRDEIGGLLLGKIKENGDVLVKNAIILEQVKTSCTFELDNNAMMDLTKNGSPKLLNSIIGWWHSHAKFDVFFSSVDDECFKRLSEFSGLCAGIVVNSKKIKKMPMKCRVDFKTRDGKYISINDINAEIQESFFNFISEDRLKEEIKEKIKEVEPMIINDIFPKNDTILEKINKEEVLKEGIFYE
jgi:proteasome lid subunit RPN8/RPN11